MTNSPREELIKITTDWWFENFGEHEKDFGDLADHLIAAGWRPQKNNEIFGMDIKVDPNLKGDEFRIEPATDIDDEKYNDNWPEGSLEQFIWVRCEMDNKRVREIMKAIARFGTSQPKKWTADEISKILEYHSAWSAGTKYVEVSDAATAIADLVNGGKNA